MSTNTTHKLRLKIAYDGTSYSGWQVQNVDRSIQGTIEKALFTIINEDRRIIGSGRTDAGVHALGQVAHVSIKKDIKPNSLKKALNAILPHEIRILAIEEVPDSFHAQISAIGKEYHYHLCLDEVVLPFHRSYVWHYRKKINQDLLQKAAEQFIGEFDFRGFSNALGGGQIKHNTIRRLTRLDIITTPNGLRLEFEGNGFLYKMVRNITGILLSIASNHRPIEDIAKIFESKDRRLAGAGAPPQGLFLVTVFYPSSLI
jgi:tRNA pseudouridine38-40 synthase